MSDVDVAAIRARCADLRNLRAIASRTAYTGDDLTEAKATELANALADELARADVPALLDALATRDARIAEQDVAIAQAREDIDASSADLGRCRELLAKTKAMVERAYGRLEAETAEPEAHPPVDEYRVQVHDPVDDDLPSGGWVALGIPHATLERAVTQMRLKRERRPELGPLRVLRIRRSYTVVASESAPPADAGQDAVDRVSRYMRSVHQPYLDEPDDVDRCRFCGVVWPCPTIQAVDAAASPADGPGPHATENGPGRAPGGPAASERATP